MTNAGNKQHRTWASQAVERFVSRFDESYRLLAYHAALPLVLTPELVNYLRNEFLRGEQVPWVAEVDLLLSDLCSQVGYELYAMDTHVRAYLLEQMEQDSRWGRRRMQEVAQVLISYVNYLSRLNPGRRKQEIEAQRWAAMVYLGDEECKTAAKEIAQRLLETSSGNESKNSSQSGIRAELARITRITEELSRPLRKQESLLRYARLVQQILRNPEQVNPEELGDSFDVEGVELRFPIRLLPEPLVKTVAVSRDTVTQFEGFPPIQTFKFDVATYLESEFEICTFQVATIETGKNIKWLFQGNPEHYRILDAIRDLEEIIWPVKIKSYFKQMAVEDVLLIWVSGKEAGIYALAKIVELLKESQEVPDIDYSINTEVIDSGNDKPKARLCFTTKLLEEPLLKKKLKKDDILKDLLVIRNPLLALTKITSEESKRIYELIKLIKGLDLIVKTETKQSEYYTEELAEGVELEMISIPGGSFTMGSPAAETDSYEDERPQHQVTVPSFYMGRYPITQAQWQAIAELEPVSIELGPDPSYFKEDYEEIDRWKRPVEQVSWEEATEFCDRLSRETAKEYRLPTEAEWEYACRAGTTTPFHFGETISTELANYDGRATYGEGVEGVYREQTTPVGYFQVANNFGLYDMHGNVWEWCEDDWHKNHQDAPNEGSARVLEQSINKVMRGVSWNYNPRYCRSAIRDFSSRGSRDSLIGFRVVRVAP